MVGLLCESIHRKTFTIALQLPQFILVIVSENAWAKHLQSSWDKLQNPQTFCPSNMVHSYYIIHIVTSDSAYLEIFGAQSF